MSKYYQLAIGADEKAWHLAIRDVFADGTPVDIWAYRGCRRLRNPKPVPFAIQVDGDRIDYYPSAFCTTVVSRRLADLWERLAGDDIQAHTGSGGRRLRRMGGDQHRSVYRLH